MFSFLVAIFSFRAVFTSSACFVNGVFFKEASDADVFDTGMHFYIRASTAVFSGEIFYGNWFFGLSVYVAPR